MGGIKASKPVVRDKALQAKLDNLRAWQEFSRHVIKMEDENEVLEYLELERKHFNRSYVKLRIFGRFNALRTRRERDEILNGEDK